MFFLMKESVDSVKAAVHTFVAAGLDYSPYEGVLLDSVNVCIFIHVFGVYHCCAWHSCSK